MTLQQIEYVVALFRTRHFAQAAEMCGVTQPTLSAMIQKLEEELDVKLFDRKRHPIEPTAIGMKVVEQCIKALNESTKIKELIQKESHSLEGHLRLGVIPTISPYLVPRFIAHFTRTYPNVDLKVFELQTKDVLDKLRHNELDMAILTTPLDEKGLLEIPLYYEKFLAYFSQEDKTQDTVLTPFNMPLSNLWTLQEGHCARNQIFNFCNSKVASNSLYEAGSIDTLIKIVDQNGGYTVIPEMHLEFLTDDQHRNIVTIENPPAVREVSILIREDYVRERLINAVADTVKEIIPQNMLDERLKKFSIRL